MLLNIFAYAKIDSRLLATVDCDTLLSVTISLAIISLAIISHVTIPGIAIIAIDGASRVGAAIGRANIA